MAVYGGLFRTPNTILKIIVINTPVSYAMIIIVTEFNVPYNDFVGSVQPTLIWSVDPSHSVIQPQPYIMYYSCFDANWRPEADSVVPRTHLLYAIVVFKSVY